MPATTTSAPLPQAIANRRAVGWMMLSMTCFISMTIAARQMNNYHDTFEIMAVRSAIGVILVLLAAKASGRLGEIRMQRLGGHFFRNAVHFTGQNLWFWAMMMIPLAQLFALEFTSPIWVILLSPFFLGEKLNPTRIFAAILGFIGVLIVARPDFSHIDLGVVAAAASAIFFATTNIATKRLTRDETIVSIMFWLTLMQFSFGAILAFADGHVTWPTWQTMPWLCVIALCGVVAHMSLTNALRLAPASFVMPFDFLRLPLIAVLAWALYGESLEAILFAGAALIIVANLINIRSGAAKPQKGVK